MFILYNHGNPILGLKQQFIYYFLLLYGTIFQQSESIRPGVHGKVSQSPYNHYSHRLSISLLKQSVPSILSSMCIFKKYYLNILFLLSRCNILLNYQGMAGQLLYLLCKAQDKPVDNGRRNPNLETK